MADLASITAVRPTADTVYSLVVYGATVAAGDVLYLDSNDNEYKLADNDVTATEAAAKGIAMTPGVDAGYGLLATAGSIILVGTTAAVGETYFLSSNPGKIAPDADTGSGDFITRIGTASAATTIKLAIEATGIAHA